MIEAPNDYRGRELPPLPNQSPLRDESSTPFQEDIELQNMDEPEEDITDNELREESSQTEDERNEVWTLLKTTNPITRLFKKIWNGPDEPSDENPTFFEKYPLARFLNNLPTETFRKRSSRKHMRILSLVVYCVIWMGINLFFLFPHFMMPSYFIPDTPNAEKVPVIYLQCNSYLNLEGTNNACGLFNEDCGPFENKDYYISCPALCDQGGLLYSAVAVGPKRVKYTNYIIGGGIAPNVFDREDNILSNPLRADSYPCAAATHLGLISPITGGCAKLTMSGSQVSFPSTEGEFKMGWSIDFRSFFPSSFSFLRVTRGYMTGCFDPRSPVVTLNILMGIPIFYLYESLYGYWIIIINAYWTLVLVLDPPVFIDPNNRETVYALFSVGFQRLLPLCFIFYVMWKVAIKRTLDGGSPLLKLFMWYPLFWLGVMNNITFDRLPVDRLNPKDLKEQPGAMTAVGAILSTIIICAFTQAYMLWKSGRFQKYFKIYITLILGIVVLASLPGLNLRIHHYILGMVLLPGCATRSVTAYLFQGILLGLVISGVGRWDFASIVETNYALLRDEAGALLKPPAFIFDTENPHLISWTKPDVTSYATNETESEFAKNWHGKIDGYSLLLNDFEVYVGTNNTVDLDILINSNELLSNMVDASLNSTDNSVELYLRIARASVKSPKDYRGDYTNAGVLIWPDGVWYDPLPGVS
ncbi:hypothetical protein DAKH74_019940 [Maudiozyma humilis]|uniref:LCCL domain-containing protein n=1 Tax=Maudiozyma humilis TaxID=51915 RepID=A0AAV5RXM0_MAUHU|nr:hypothetical protein DAKH74_019940 [Kazachstania humilis]